MTPPPYKYKPHLKKQAWTSKENRSPFEEYSKNMSELNYILDCFTPFIVDVWSQDHYFYIVIFYREASGAGAAMVQMARVALNRTEKDYVWIPFLHMLKSNCMNFT